MKAVLLFLAKLLGISLVLYAVHKPLMMAYEYVLLTIIFQFPSSKAMLPGQYYDSSLWLIPTIALVLATPKISWKRRSLMVILGICVYWMLDFISFYIWTSPPLPNNQSSQVHYLYSMIWGMTGQWALPFLVWLVTAYRQVGRFFEVRT
ncbi:MAG: hypothetical protein RQ754_14175 [Desulfuromonadales bacterium]|nr:hypothetical protein [Desulfuromonadales bacterium]